MENYLQDLKKRKREVVLQAGCVLMTLGAFLRFFFSISYLSLFAKMKLMKALDVLDTAAFTVMWVTAILSLLLMMVVGIMGISATREPRRAMKCFVLGLITLITNLISNITQTKLGFSSEVLWVVGTAAPLIYTIGAFIRRKR